MGTIDAFQRQVWSPQFKQNCFPHRSKMGVLKSFLNSDFRAEFFGMLQIEFIGYWHWSQGRATRKDIFACTIVFINGHT